MEDVGANRGGAAANVAGVEDTAENIAEAAARLVAELREATDGARAIKQSITALEEERKRFEALVESKQKEIDSKQKELADKQKVIGEKQRQLHTGVGGGQEEVPECPVCSEEMAAPVHIFSCENGHLICGGCRPRTRHCAECRDKEYIVRNLYAEQRIRAITRTRQ